MTSSGDRRAIGAKDILTLAVFFGLAAGVIEATAWAVRRFAFDQITSLSPHTVWMAPFVYTVLLGLLALGILAVERLSRRTLPAGAVIFMLALPAIIAALLLVPRLHRAALLLLAAGVAYQFQHAVRSSPTRWTRIARRGVAALLAVVCVASGVIIGTPIAAERRDGAALGAARDGAPDVLFIILDTVRAASLSLYGYGRETTPSLERLGSGGVVFEHAVSTAPWTLPSHASMFTGLYPHELGADWRDPLDPDPTTLAEALAARGYATAGFVANTGYASRETGLARGFHHYADFRVTAGEMIRSAGLTNLVAGSFRVRKLLGTDEHLNRQPAPVVTGRFLDWLDEQPEGRPVFAFLNYYDAHGPYLPPPSHATRFGPARADRNISPVHRWNWDPAVRHNPLTDRQLQEEIDAYDAAMAFLDEQLGALFDELKRRGRLDRTLVVVTSDHGEEFGEHAVFDHGNSLYFASVHVPLIIRLPDRVPAGVRVENPVTLRDLPATVLSLVEPGADTVFPGRSLASAWDESAVQAAAPSLILSEVSQAPGHPDWFPVSRGDMKAVLTDGVRYIRNGDGEEELYAIMGDPWELEDLASREDRAAALDLSRSLLNRLLTDGEPRAGVVRP